MTDWEIYKKQIISQIQFWANKINPVQIQTIFFGGGTPSLMPTKIFSEIMNVVRDSFEISTNAEISFESNPGTLDATRLSEFSAAGVNRLSIGVQSLSDDVLKFLGRGHSVKDSMNLIKSAQNLGLRLNADFIYGLPNQSVSDVIELCQQINEMNLQHVSLYELTIEHGTPFYGNVKSVTDECGEQMYNAISQNLNLQRYEVSNYAAGGFECRHNQNVWDGQPYVGFGNGGCGRVLLKDKYWFEQGYTNSGEEIFASLDPRARAMEMLITGLRQTRGVKISSVQEIVDWDFIKSEIDNGKLLINDDRLCATEKGILILDNLLLGLLK